MPGAPRSTRGSSRLVTVALWLLAGALAVGGMALDARGAFLPSIFVFLLASAALVAPLALARRSRRPDGDP